MHANHISLNQTTLIPWLQEHAQRKLGDMFLWDKSLFVFRLRKVNDSLIPEGISRRYSAIALIGLSPKKQLPGKVFDGETLDRVAQNLLAALPRIDNLGDTALILWALRLWDFPDRRPAWERLKDLLGSDIPQPTVELAWALAALCVDEEAPLEKYRKTLAENLTGLYNEKSGLFPHLGRLNNGNLRSHVSCFADLIYPIQALSFYHRLSGDQRAIDQAAACASRLCRLQGDAGQWWWHYDYRTGSIIEKYPVYSIHQDAMAPMGLFALKEAGGPDHTREIMKGLSWLLASPEIEGQPLIDRKMDIIWRKVARKEPNKWSRSAQALASRVHPAWRVPGMDTLFPPGAIDYEDRPYHLGWLLYAWPPSRSN
jgi:hypothetical protein